MKTTNQKKVKSVVTIIAAAFILSNAAIITRAAGLLIADGGFGGQLEIKEQQVNVVINNGIAVTRVMQVFHNTEKRQVEALYTFPVPKSASIANFSMWINGKEVIGEVLEKKRAREIYESYKKTRRDPGLLEQVDYKTFEMRIFPINANADQKVEIVYYQELDYDHDSATYVYPLATATRKGIDSQTKGKFSFNLEVKSVVPIVKMKSPSHGKDIVIAKHSDSYYQASLETTKGNLNKDIVVYYNTSRPHTGLDLIVSKSSKEDGFFYTTLTVGKDLAKFDSGMDYIFVLDVSGSMADFGKLEVSRNSISAFIDALGEKDRFEILTFNVQPDTLFKELEKVTPESKAKAVSFLESKSARGGTVLNPAINTAYSYRDSDRPLNVIILSDGLTEQRERQTLLELISQRPSLVRVFCIGVGNDVNKPLLEQLAQDSGGLAAFVSKGDDFERQAKAFRRKLVRPSITDIQIDFGGIGAYDVEPRVLPNLYHGSPLRVYGRYKKSGEAEISIKGNILGKPFKKSFNADLPEKDSDNPEIERMWAWHRIDNLQKLADRTGSRDKVIDEIVQLGETYSIVSEYTSFLVLENDAEFRRWKIERRNMARSKRDRGAWKRNRKKLDEIRNKALVNIGPAAAKPKTVTKRQAVPTHVPVSSQRVVQNSSPGVNRKSRSRGNSFNIGGSGPIGLISIIVIGLMKFKTKKN